MAPRKTGRKSGVPKNRFIAPPANEGSVRSYCGRSKDDDANELFGLRSASPIDCETHRAPTSPPSELTQADRINIKIESDFDEEMNTVPSYLGGNPDPGWLWEWRTLDLKSAIQSQVDFFKTCPRFTNAADCSYVEFFNELQKTLLGAEAAGKTITEDAIAKANVNSLRIYLDNFVHNTRWLLRYDLGTRFMGDYRQCPTLADVEYLIELHIDWLKFTKNMASFIGLKDGWAALWKIVHAMKKSMRLDKDRGLFDSAISSLQEIQRTNSSLRSEGPLSPEMLKMDYEFTDAIWSQWIDSCTSYFTYWTADSANKFPAEDFVRHLSHHQLAMALSHKHKTISDEKHSTLLKTAKKYMSQYREYAAEQLETKYATLKEDVKKTNIYLTEARFWQLADDTEVFMNDPPTDIKTEAWNDAVPAMLPRDKVFAAKNAINVLYKEFQTKRYPEDEFAYLWSLIWRNIKHTLPYFTSPPNLDAIRPEPEGLPTIEARDLALPFVEKNLSRLLTIVRKDNDALYQKEIESLVGEYCAHFDRYVHGKGEGQERIYAKFARLSNTKRVPFVCLVHLEESLLKEEAQPTNASQTVVHRVVKRLNHIMEGPKKFNRWELSEKGPIRTFSPTATWIEEQETMRQYVGFKFDDAEKAPSSPSSSDPSQLPAAGAGAGGGDDGDDDDKRNPPSADNGASSSSDEEVEVVSPGGTKRIEKRKKARRATPSATAETLTKAKLEQLGKLSKRPDSDSRGSGSGSQADEEEDEAEIMPGQHPLPSDSLDYHRRRLTALRVEQTSAVPHAQYPLPETTAPQRAAALQIARELADPGIYTEGPRVGDVQDYINPALRLPSTEDDSVTGPQGVFPISCIRASTLSGQKSPSDCVPTHADNANPCTEGIAGPNNIRRALRRVRDTLGSPFFGSSPRRSPPRSRPRIPESNAQRARRERQALETTPPVLKRQPDKYSVRKAPPCEGRSRHAADIVSSSDGGSGADRDLPWNGQNHAHNAASSGGSSHQSAQTTQESQTPSTDSPIRDSSQENRTPSTNSPGNSSNKEHESAAKDSNQENRTPSTNSSSGNKQNRTPSTNSPGKNSNQENESPAKDPTQENHPAQGNADDWNSPSPPRQYDNTIYQGSSISDYETPTPARGNNSQISTGPGLPPLPPADTQASPNVPIGGNVNASRPDPPSDDGPNPRLGALNRWVNMELTAGNQDMRIAYRLHRQLRDQSLDTLNYLFEMLRGVVEMANFNNYVFERETTFGPEAHVRPRRGVPRMVRPPGTPPAQIDADPWWNDPLEGTRDAINRSAASWAQSPSEEGQQQPTRNSQRGPRTPTGSSVSYTPRSPSPMRDELGNIIPWPTHEIKSPKDDDTVRFPPVSTDSQRTWSWHSNPDTGLPQREFNIYINPDNRPRVNPLDLGEALLVQDPLIPAQLIPNPRFSPEILRLISAGGRDDHGQINIRVPPGWRVNFGPAAGRGTRSPAISPPGSDGSSSSGPSQAPGDQQVTITGPGFVIHEDSPSDGSVRDRSNAPPTLGLIQRPIEHEDVVESVEKDPAGLQMRPTHGGGRSNQGSGSNPDNGNNQRGGNIQGTLTKNQCCQCCECGKGCNKSNAEKIRPSRTGVFPPSTSQTPPTISDLPSPPNHSPPHSSYSPKSPPPSTGSSRTPATPPHSPTLPTHSSGKAPGKKVPRVEPPAGPPEGPAVDPAASPPAEPPAQPPSETHPETPHQTPPPQPWYLAWETSTCARLRAELLRRGIPLKGLRTKQHMIDRLRRDDQENGVGGVWSPDEVDEGAEEEEEEEEEDREDAGDDEKGVTERKRSLKRQANPFALGDGMGKGEGQRAAKRRAR